MGGASTVVCSLLMVKWIWVSCVDDPDVSEE